MADLTPGSTAIVTTATDPSINFRGDPSTDHDPIGKLARGLAVIITGPPVGAFFPIRTPDGQTGWAGGAYLIPAPAPIATPPAPTPALAVPVPTVNVTVDPSLIPPAAAPAGPNKMLLLGGGALALVAVAAVAMSGGKKKKRR